MDLGLLYEFDVPQPWHGALADGRISKGSACDDCE
jgi:hypothetical protein